MTMNFDIKTLFFLFSLGNIFTVVYFSIYILLYKIQKLKLKIYVLAKLFQSTAWILFLFREKLYDNFAIAAANVLLLFGMAFEYYSMVTINQKFKKKKFLILLLSTLVFSVIFVFFINAPDYIRVFLMSLFISCYFMFAGIELTFCKFKTKMQKVTGILAFMMGVFFLLRAGHAFYIPKGAFLYAQNIIQILTYIAFFLITYSWPIIFLFLLKEHDELIILANKKRIENDNKSLKELNATKDKLFSIIAHDLRSPFSAILGFSELMIYEIENKDFTKIEFFNKIIYTSTQQTFNLLNNLLQWSRIQTGSLKFNSEVLNLDKIIMNTVNLLKANFDEKEIEFTKIIDAKLTLKADAFMFETVIRNLLSNAIKYTSNNGKVSIKVVETKREVQISIKDTGVGISLKNIKKLFKIESSFSTEGTNNEKGTGLGLMLCKEFIERHNGEIWVESEENKGSNFIFTIPK